jgi:transcription initiation factor TFIIE subunit alpha
MTVLLLAASTIAVLTFGGFPDYDDYYASLAAGTQSRSTPTSGVQDDLGGGDDEDIKPNVEYLDSLNDYRKRARSPAVTDWDAPASKMARAESPPQMEPEIQMDITSGDSNDPIVYGTFVDEIPCKHG